MHYRSKPLLDSANGQVCVTCGDRGTTVACHVNSVSLGKGTGIKAPDYYTVWWCQACHNLYDGRAGTLTREEKAAMFARAYYQTVARWFDLGIVVVKGSR